MPYGLSDTGLEMPRMADYRLIIQTDLESRLAARGIPAPDWERDTFLGPLVDALAARLDESSEAVIQIHDGYDPNNAAGLQLENICALIGLRRREATFSTVTVTLTATAACVIPEGSLVEDDDGDRWETTSAVTFAPGGGTDTVVVQAIEAGVVEAPINTITKIVTPVSGWSAVINDTEAATAGEARETDSELRKRRLLSLQRGTSATVAGIRSAVFDLDWTTATTVIENVELTSETVEGLTLPGKSLAVVVYPDTPTADQIDDLVDALVETCPAGIERFGTQSQSYDFDDGHSATYYWSYATQTAVDVTVTATALSGFSTAEVQAEIEDQITDYFLALGVGDDVRSLPIAALIDTVDGAESATVTVDGGSIVTITATELAIEGTISVTVT